jgi:tape measure domain-containing protein
MMDVGMDNELQKMNMTTLFKGNAAAAEDMFARISKYGKETVYDKSGLIEAQKTMMSFGLSGEKSFITLKQIGDIAMGDSQKMQSLSLAFSQMSSTGKLMGQDLMQMINAGFNPLQVISQKTGKSMGDLKEEMSKGAISADMVAQAFQWATEEGGLFYQGAEKAGETTVGRINQLKDTFDEFLISIFEKLKPVIDFVIEKATTITSKLGDFVDKVIEITDAIIDFSPLILGIASAIGVLTIAVNAQNIALQALIMWETICNMATALWSGTQAILNAVMAANPIVWVIAAIAALIGIIVYLCKHVTGLGNLWKGVVGFMKYTFYAYVDSVKLYFATLVNGIMIGLDKIKLGWYKFKEACGIGNSKENQAAIAQINADVEKRQKAIVDGAKSVKENLLKAEESLTGGIKGLSWKSDKEKKENPLGINDNLINAVNGGSGETGSGKTTEAGKSTEAIATGGTRNTEVHITIGDMIRQVTFNGTTAENKQEIERNFAECLYRVLGMAQVSV